MALPLILSNTLDKMYDFLQEKDIMGNDNTSTYERIMIGGIKYKIRMFKKPFPAGRMSDADYIIEIVKKD